MTVVQDCVFCKIGSGEIKVDPIFENSGFIAFRDTAPQAPIHVLLIPKAHYETVMDFDNPLVMGQAMQAVQQIAKILNMDKDGFRTVINTRDNGGQTVKHFHIHIMGGRFMQWPPG